MSENSEEKDNVSQSFSFEDLKIAHRNNVMSKKFSFLKLKENYRSIVQPNATIVEEVPKEIIVTAPTQAESTAENTFNAVSDEIQENPQTVFEKKSFVQRSKEKFYDIFVGQKTKAEIICDAILIFTILFASITSFVWFATPITEIGGISYAGKTLNLYAFLFGDENSLFAQMKIAWESLSSLGNMTSEEMVGAVGVVMKFLRLIFLAVPTIVIGVKIIINLIMTPIHLSKKNFFGLRNTAVSSVACNLMVYVFFVFFGSISGGVGIDAYYIGYKVGTGMTVGVLISTVILIGTAITLFIDQRYSITQEVGTKWIKSLITGMGCVGIAIVLTFMRIYSIFMYVFSSSLSAALLSIMNGFEVKSLVFPVLNLFLFVACLVIYGRVNVGIRGSFSYLLNFNNNQIPLKQMAKKKKMDKRYAISFIPFIVLALLSVVSVYVLSTPTFGYGWSVDIYAEFVAIFAIAAIGMSISIFFGKGIITFNNAAAKGRNTKGEDNMETYEVIATCKCGYIFPKDSEKNGIFSCPKCKKQISATKAYKKSLKTCMKAAKKKDPSAQNSLGECYYYGHAVAKNYSIAVSLFKEAAAAGNSRALNNLGECYYDGNGVGQNYTEAVKCYRQAAEKGNADAQYSLGYCYANGQGIESDASSAASWYLKAAMQGHMKAQRRLAFCYADGEGVGQDYREAFKWFTKAAEQGDSSAQLRLAFCYADGEGVEQNYREAFKWFKKAAEQNEEGAWYLLATYYENGNGTAKNIPEAIKWYSKFAEGSSEAAQKANAAIQIALFYQRGDGVTQNNDEALKWYKKAAGLGSSMAESGIGVIYSSMGDLDEAIRWLKLAISHGYEDAKEALRPIEDLKKELDKMYPKPTKEMIAKYMQQLNNN